ncbi:uncharacterized protein LOC114273902 [Camellia sinensis]|uniref:uncharacterized protein LOC114273902 n=1 Tax=Camellia sinensis TaxID=4442 RepID=UPI001036724B|nr:uncharacterized protein LOC114273902 [Camellia sinensis]XP_028071522.1 uncharacterized protein LOC114273902 [Camellia sinensis]
MLQGSLKMLLDPRLRDLVEIRDSSYNWPLTFRRHLFEWEKEELLRINGILRGAPTFNLQVNDLALWSAAKPCQTLVSIFYNHTNLALGPNVIFSRWVWINYLPPKVQFFGWLAWRNKVKTLVFLQQLGILDRDSSTLCTFCKSQQESIEHVLIFCPMVWRVWSELLQWWGVVWVVPRSIQGLFQW